MGKFADALESTVERGKRTRNGFIRLSMDDEHAARIGAGDVKYRVYWGERQDSFWVRTRTKDGRFTIGPKLAGRVARSDALTMWKVIRGIAKRPPRPYKKTSKEVPSVYQFGLSEVFAAHPHIRGDTGLSDHRDFLGRRTMYQSMYLRPMQVLAELGLIRFGTTSWRVE